MSAQLLLEVKGLTVRYAGRSRKAAGKTALNEIDITVNTGETVGLVGESGSGKSTLGNAILGLVRPTLGTINFDGQDITHLRPVERRGLSQDIQAVFQDPYSSFNPNRTVGDSVGETLSTQVGLSPRDRRRRVGEMLERVGLGASAADRYPGEFSGGQRQRIAIARALLPSPRLIVCDESVSALDLSVQAQILNLLADLQRETGVAYLFITHDLSVVRHVSNRVVVLHHGSVVEQGTNHEVIDSPQKAYTQTLLAASPVPDPDLQRVRREARRALVKLTQAIAAAPDEAATGLEQSLEFLTSLSSLRQVLERKAASEASKHRKPELLRPIAAAVEEMDKAETAKDFFQADVAFHEALFAASGSPEMAYLPATVTAAVAQTVRAGTNRIYDEADKDQLRELHRAIYQAISAGDSHLAMERVDDHFRWLDHALSAGSRNPSAFALSEVSPE